MNKIESYQGKELFCNKIGLVKVIERAPKSITRVIVEEIDRGSGYDERTDTYIGVKSKKGWQRGENFDFGKTHEVHIKELNI